MKKLLCVLIVIVASSCISNAPTKKQSDNDSAIVLLKTVYENVKEKPIDSLKVNSLPEFFKKNKDEFSSDGLTWYKHINSPKYHSSRSGIYCYFGIRNNKPMYLRLVVQYCSEDWLFFKKIRFSIDDMAFEYIPDEVEHDNNSTIWEWCDNALIRDNDKLLIRTLSNAKDAKMKFIGSKYYDIKIISKADITAIRQTIEMYEALGGNF
ncbi:MAG: hypothetical protein LBH06_08915 [Rikenellaceae bacterium]|jgi:hypothetical protein|nr:hypothetical protein [Rikenellaceae bacterium]